MKDMRIYELVEQFNNLVESNPISKRYITAIRLALKRYQQEHHVTSFKQINVAEFFKYRGIGPKALYLLWQLYGKPEAWQSFVNEKYRLDK